jgi:3',5'-cyclic AMP phosphodiesterase CpdA
MKKSWKSIAIVAALATSCLNPAEERVELDLQVGRAQHERLDVNVVDGLAAVRSLSSDELVLWGSAPSFELGLTAPTARTLTIEVQNCLTDAELVATSDGAELVALGDAGVHTRKRWQLQLPAGDTRLRLAAADADAREPFRFALLSDIQEAIDRVGDVFGKINAQPELRFLLGAGDLTQRGTRAELERFQHELLGLQVPYFTTLGNHELGTHPDLFHEYFGRGSFQFRFHGVVFTLLDDASAGLDPTTYDWLDSWLDRARGDVHIVAMHIPPIDPIGVRNGSWASRSEAAKLLARLAEGRVDLTLYGHVHSYYDFDNAGIPAFISGGGGAIPERFDRIGRHFMLFDASAANGIISQRVVRVD